MRDVECRVAVAQQLLRVLYLHVLDQALGTDAGFLAENFLEVGRLVSRALRQTVEVGRLIVMGNEIIDRFGDDLICMFHASIMARTTPQANPLLAMVRPRATAA